ncbi:MAG: HAD-IA family hydrolase [Tannerella sp.]|jgi:HAD superfamily hydrolase (TIGR01509 family)|nr:HAD-IA family hydrolase [Tannerella sp.]
MNDIKTAIERYLAATHQKKLSLRAALFDMDGVLYDSMPNHATAWVQVTSKYGFHATREEAYLHEGRTGDDTINILSAREGIEISPEDRLKIYAEKIQLFNACPPVKPMAGSRELLRQVVDSGLLAMLVTGSGQPSLLDNLNSDFPGVFTREMMVTSFDVKNGKPHPEPYLTALAKGGLQTFEAIVVENAPLGVQAAKAAGLFTVAVNTGPLPDSVLTDAGADYLLPSIEALLKDNTIFKIQTYEN